MDFEFTTLAIVLGGISLGGIGVIMAAVVFFPQQAEQYKRQIPTVIMGIILTMVAAIIVGTFS